MKAPKNHNQNGKTHLTAREAAQRIGITVRRLRQLIQDGEIIAEQVPAPVGRYPFFYAIAAREVERFIRRGRNPLGRPRVSDAG